MNIESEIANVFENNSYNDLFKVRWLYLYVCRLFSYDTRFIYAENNLKEEIYDKKIDIKNIEDFEIVCYTIGRVLVDILNSYGYKCELVRESKAHFSHIYVIVKCKDYTLKLDPTKRHDLTRVKINSNTLDFELLNESTKFEDELKEMDKIITNNYNDIDKNIYYDNEKIEELVQLVDNDAKERNLLDSEFFYEKIEYLYSLINTRTDLKRCDDMDFYYSYLIKKFKLNEKTEMINGKAVTTRINRIKPAIFFKNDDKSMKDFISLTIVEYEGIPPVFYLIKKEGECFKAREIYREEAIELLKQYRNPVCQFIFESAALRLETNNLGKIIN